METIAEVAERYKRTAEKHMPKRVEQSSGFKIAFDRCESPIEQAFCLALFQVPGIYAIEGDYRPSLAAHQPTKRGVLVFAQNPINRYRADFLLVAFSPFKAEPAFLIVECDGAAFHSDPVDMERDQAREQELRDTGFRIVRHAGSDIHKTPTKVIDSTLACLSTHGWGGAEGQKWVNDTTIRRAIATLSEGESEGDPLMGWHPPALKPVGQTVPNALKLWKALAGQQPGE